MQRRVYADSKHVEEALTYVNWLASQKAARPMPNKLGFFSPNPAASELKDERAKEWQALSNGKTMIHRKGYETMMMAPDYPLRFHVVRYGGRRAYRRGRRDLYAGADGLVFLINSKRYPLGLHGGFPSCNEIRNNNSG